MMAQIKVKFLGTFYDVTKTGNVKIKFPAGADLRYVLGLMEKKFGERFSEHVREHLDYLMIFINNVEYRQLQGLRTKINDGDIVVIGHVAAGG